MALFSFLDRFRGRKSPVPNGEGCPICEGGPARDFWDKDGGMLVQCLDCRHIYWKRFPTPQELNHHYSQVYTSARSQSDIQEGNREYYRQHVREMLDFAGLSNPGEVTLVDFGCSLPVLLEEALDIGVGRAIGVDYLTVESRVQMIRPDQIDQLADGSVDILRFSHTLEHLLNPRETLQAMRPKMRRGGLLHITQPNFPVLTADAPGVDLRDAVYPEHLHFFCPLSLWRMVRGAAFRPVRLFTHYKEEEAFRQFSRWIDERYIEEQMGEARAVGDSFFHPLGNYPHYCGENSALWALAGRPLS